MVYRLPSCDEAAKRNIVLDLNGSIKHMNGDILLINKNIAEIETVKQIANTNKADIAELKVNVSDISSRVVAVEEKVVACDSAAAEAVCRIVVVEEKIKSLDANLIPAEFQSRTQKMSNFTMYGLKENPKVNMRNVIIGKLSVIQGSNTNRIIMSRSPSRVKNQPKQLLVRLHSPNDVFLVLQNINVSPTGVTVRKDKTMMERNTYKELV